jgi:branched-chain amino acid transport system substrate-binding protein
MIRRRILLGGSAALLGAPAWAESATKPAPPPPAPIGVLLPLTGPDSLIGDECLRGIQLAAADINEAGGIAGQKLTLLPSDAAAQNDPASAARGLIGPGHAALLLGTGNAALSYPGSAAAELAQIPYIELNATAAGITGRGFKFLLRNCETTAMVAQVAVAAAAAKWPGKQIGLLFNTGATGGAAAAAILALWQAAKLSPALVAGYPEGVADLHEPVSRLKRAGVQIILHAAGVDDVLQMFQAMQDIGWTTPAILGCGDGYLLRETAYALGPIFDGTMVVGAPFYPPQAAAIAAKYEANFGMPPRAPDSLSAYVGAKLVFGRLAQSAGDPSKLLDSLRATTLPPGALANGWGVAFDKSGQNTASFPTLQQWRGGSLVAV